MDRRYTDDIDEIVRGMEGEFTARNVVDTLRQMHPNGDKGGRGTLPDARKMSEYLRTYPGIKKMGRKGNPRVNQYRCDKEWQRTTVEEPVDGEVREEIGAATGSTLEGLAEEGKAASSSEQAPDTISLSEYEERMAAIEACDHSEGWKLQETLEVCNQCGGAREFVDPAIDPIKELIADTTSDDFARMTNAELYGLHQGSMLMSHIIDKSVRGGKEMAIKYARRAQACGMKLTLNAKNQEKNIRKS